MLSLGLTGGIAAGKSLLSARFRELGAHVIDADKLAREVVAPGTPGLDAVVNQFGLSLRLADGSLDRARLGSLVFSDKAARESLNSIIHPLVRAEAESLKRAAGASTIVVQDIPLLVETGQGANFHLVVVAQAATDVRVARMVRERGMSPEDALARIAAQATDDQRAAAADVVIVNEGAPEQALAELDALWHLRLLPFAANLASGVSAPGPGSAMIVPSDPNWAYQGARIMARLAKATGENAVGIDHIGSTAVPGLAAKDVLDLQIRVRSLDVADALAQPLAEAGYPSRNGEWWDTGHDFAGGSKGQRWEKRFHNSADPGRPVNLHIRVDGSPAAVFAVTFRDWLRASPEATSQYESLKRALARKHSEDTSSAAYATAKEPYFAEVVPDMAAWLARHKTFG